MYLFSIEYVNCLNPQSKNFCNEEDVFSFAKLYDADIRDLLIHEKYQVKILIERKKKKGTNSPKTVLQLLNSIEPSKEVFQNVTKYAKLE